jgi:hypothetical protein
MSGGTLFLFWLSIIKNRVFSAGRVRWQTVVGVEVTGETIGWLIAAIILVLLGVGFALGPGTTWVNSQLDTLTTIKP